MADRPIIFSGPMVQALRAERKTQTRRALKPQPFPEVCGFQKVFAQAPYFEALDGLGKPMSAAFPGAPNYAETYPRIRISVGDRLWVREAHAYVGTIDPGWLLYRANGYESECDRHGFCKPYPPESEVRWRPSIHMPRKLSRLTLVVTDVRIERLQDISEADAVAEGIERVARTSAGDFYRNFDNPACPLLAYGAYRSLWNAINGAGAWDANPWVVAYSFEVLRGNVDEIAA